MGGRRATKQVSDIAARIMSECTAYRLRIVNRAISKIYDDDWMRERGFDVDDAPGTADRPEGTRP